MLGRVRAAIWGCINLQEQTPNTPEKSSVEEVWNGNSKQTPLSDTKKIKGTPSVSDSKETEAKLFRCAVEGGEHSEALYYAEYLNPTDAQELVRICIENKWEDVLLIVFRKTGGLYLFANSFIDQLSAAGIENEELNKVLQQMKDQVPLPTI